MLGLNAIKKGICSKFRRRVYNKNSRELRVLSQQNEKYYERPEQNFIESIFHTFR